MREAPGERSERNSGGAVLLGGALVRATGQPIRLFARKRLFEPVGIRELVVHWAADNLAHTGGGLNMRAPDIARLGYLMLKKRRVALRADRQRGMAVGVDAALERTRPGPSRATRQTTATSGGCCR